MASDTTSQSDAEAPEAEGFVGGDVDPPPNVRCGLLQETPSTNMRPCHYYIHVPHAANSTYDVHERNVPIDPQFHTDLKEHNNNISQFLALPKVIPTRKRKRQQPLLDFLKSKILTSLAYTRGCEELLAQRTSLEAEAKRKQAEKEANRESKVREKEERQ